VLGAPGLRDRLGEPTLLCEAQAIPLPGDGVALVEPQDPAKLALRARPVPVIVPLDKRERRASLRQRVVDVQGVHGRRPSAGHDRLGR
jgi:hypothetical protein